MALENKIKILIVEPNSIIAEDLKKSVESMDSDYEASVVKSGSGTEAIHDAERIKPDLVLMDINLNHDPNKTYIDGIDTAYHIYRRVGCPVIYLSSGHLNNENFEKIKETEAPAAYLSMSLLPSDLYVNIELALQKKNIQKNKALS